jgi:hypothetical protein
MQGILKRIVSFANIYNQLKFLVIVLSPFLKRAPEIILLFFKASQNW